MHGLLNVWIHTVFSTLYTDVIYFCIFFFHFSFIIQEPHTTNAYYAMESFDCETNEMKTITKQIINEIRNWTNKTKRKKKSKVAIIMRKAPKKIQRRSQTQSKNLKTNLPANITVTLLCLPFSLFHLDLLIFARYSISIARYLNANAVIIMIIYIWIYIWNVCKFIVCVCVGIKIVFLLRERALFSFTFVTLALFYAWHNKRMETECAPLGSVERKYRTWFS